ncbi:hypothetical protein ACH5RR_025179 [Cinchona calisaya]|uniref:Uncharacterized protein n=1 Tax=Cinchona calisaya TaxID=153742 RepID=A0ABD2Z2Y4_9GENT
MRTEALFWLLGEELGKSGAISKEKYATGAPLHLFVMFHVCINVLDFGSEGTVEEAPLLNKTKSKQSIFDCQCQSSRFQNEQQLLALHHVSCASNSFRPFHVPL